MISFAMAEVIAHSHYMKGGEGSVPGGAAGLRRTTTLVEDLVIPSLGIHAARNKYGTCRGRWKELEPTGKQFAKGNVDRDEWLPAYLDELKAGGQPSTLWKSFNNTGLFPRLSEGYLYLGEDCRNKRHFDCEGLIVVPEKVVFAERRFDSASFKLRPSRARVAWSLSFAGDDVSRSN